MTAMAFQRGHPIIFRNQWEYMDGHDACLGLIPEITSACCGHGKESGFSI